MADEELHETDSNNQKDWQSETSSSTVADETASKDTEQNAENASAEEGAAYGVNMEQVQAVLNATADKATLTPQMQRMMNRQAENTKRVEETPNVVSFTLTPADGGKVPSYKPGQFVSVRAYLPEVKFVQPRQYSLSRAPLNNNELRISVKRADAHGDIPAGLMSNHLHANLKVGSTIDVSAPTGEFFLAEGTNPVVLVAGGIGITPLFAMLETIAEKTPQRPVTMVQVAHDNADLPLAAEVRAECGKLANLKAAVYLTRAQACDKTCGCPFVNYGKRPSAADIKALAPTADSDVYICGPMKFMDDMRTAFVEAGVPAEKIHTEAFGTGNQS